MEKKLEKEAKGQKLAFKTDAQLSKLVPPRSVNH